MDRDTFNLLIGLAGLVFGFIAAYDQVRAFVLRLFRVSNDAVKRWLKRGDDRIEVFLAYPSAFIGFVVNRVAFVIFLMLVSLFVPAAIRLGLIVAPEWMATIARLVPPSLAGLLLGTLTSVSGDLIKAAKKARRGASVDG